MLVCSLDLEMNKPSGKIIEVGYTIGDPHSGCVVMSRGLIVNPEEPLDPFITSLTSITEDMIKDEGITLLEAYKHITKDCENNLVHRQPVVWGGGDMRTLRQQVWEKEHNALVDNWSFGYTEMNIKNIVQAILTGKMAKTQGGLARSMTKFGLNFKGTKHRAIHDSLNTFFLYVELLKRLQVVEAKTK